MQVPLTSAMMGACYAQDPTARRCVSDPDGQGILRRTLYKHCTNGTDPLYLGRLISQKNCESCSADVIPKVRLVAV